MSPRILRVSLIACVALSQGCMWKVGRGGPPRLLPKHYGERTTADRDKEGIPFGQKTVVGKEKPTRLLARDGTSCVVSRKKYESTVLGTPVWCSWIETDR